MQPCVKNFMPDNSVVPTKYKLVFNGVILTHAACLTLDIDLKLESSVIYWYTGKDFHAKN